MTESTTRRASATSSSPLGTRGCCRALTDQNVEEVWNFYGNPYVINEVFGTGNHVEIRGSLFFAGNLLAYGNAMLTILLMGGTTTMLAGDEYAEGQQLRFKAKGGIPTLWQLRLRQLPQDTIARPATADDLSTPYPDVRAADVVIERVSER
jgi:hypothetical protein